MLFTLCQQQAQFILSASIKPEAKRWCREGESEKKTAAEMLAYLCVWVEHGEITDNDGHG